MGVKKFKRTGMTGTYEYSEGAVSIENLQETSGTLIRVIVSDKAAGDIKFYDATSGTTGQMMTIDTTDTETTYEIGINFVNGLRWVKTGNAKITVVYA